MSLLNDLFNPEQITQLHDMYTSKGASPKEIETLPLPKPTRTTVHQVIRTVFNNKLESNATSTGTIRITYPHTQSRRSTNAKFPQGEYVYFTLKKNNRDTMSTASLLTKWLNCRNKVIGYAGTKDRRAVTTQRCSAWKIHPQRLAALNKIGNPMGIYLGDFVYSKGPVKLGDLLGNRFTITLREVPTTVTEEEIHQSMAALRERGFINYYGMQRFGTSLVSTHSIGALLLNGQWKAAVEAILHVKAGGTNDSLHARELYAQGDIQGAFDEMPRTCIAERAVLNVLKTSPHQFSNAFQAVRFVSVF
jgi:tRNA pseudouridine13 synthase